MFVSNSIRWILYKQFKNKNKHKSTRNLKHAHTHTYTYIYTYLYFGKFSISSPRLSWVTISCVSYLKMQTINRIQRYSNIKILLMLFFYLCANIKIRIAHEQTCKTYLYYTWKVLKWDILRILLACGLILCIIIFIIMIFFCSCCCCYFRSIRWQVSGRESED